MPHWERKIPAAIPNSREHALILFIGMPDSCTCSLIANVFLGASKPSPSEFHQSWEAKAFLPRCPLPRQTVLQTVGGRRRGSEHILEQPVRNFCSDRGRPSAGNTICASPVQAASPYSMSGNGVGRPKPARPDFASTRQLKLSFKKTFPAASNSPNNRTRPCLFPSTWLLCLADAIPRRQDALLIPVAAMFGSRSFLAEQKTL